MGSQVPGAWYHIPVLHYTSGSLFCTESLPHSVVAVDVIVFVCSLLRLHPYFGDILFVFGVA